MTTIELLIDEAKEKAGIKSDNALAKEIGITRQTMSDARHGRTTFGTYSRQRLADLTGRHIDEINALIEIETETDEAKKEYWKNFYKRLGGVAASLAVISITALPVTQALDNTVYYVKSLINRFRIPKIKFC